jgi:hypothetical protein
LNILCFVEILLCHSADTKVYSEMFHLNWICITVSYFAQAKQGLRVPFRVSKSCKGSLVNQPSMNNRRMSTLLFSTSLNKMKDFQIKQYTFIFEGLANVLNFKFILYQTFRYFMKNTNTKRTFFSYQIICCLSG